ncbi:hypothetical protein [Clostridium tagluense]|uniref:Uncharacterized protein n=1 Tax=Clostridium tagluense TaxID=360422 RepID=A0A401UUA2_9CLOT|nr:hypothetical protein [Clostridium tagluense]GCD13076.1 hypothetical protein Ctaglu_46990 [Clostridium tagluense]
MITIPMEYDDETGEVIREASTVFELQDIRRNKKYANMKKESNVFHSFVSENYGSFFFLFYKDLSKLVDKQYSIRFLYICTFSNYAGNLIYGNAKGDGRYMVAKDLHEVLGLGKNETNKTKNILISAGLISENEKGHLLLNTEYSAKGKLNKTQKKATKVRIFEDAIRTLYEKATPREHKQLGLLIVMLPLISLKYNVVCENPTCELESEIVPISLKKLAEMLGYEVDKNSASKLKRVLFNIKVAGEYVIMVSATGNGTFVTVNPRIFYKGTLLENVEYLTKMFKLAVKTK